MSEPGDFAGLLALLGRGKVEFILVGGIAATVHGSAHVTYDLDVVYWRTPENIGRLVTGLASVQPYRSVRLEACPPTSTRPPWRAG